MKFTKIKRRGQAMVLYALLMPLLFLFVGVGLDLGWYYLNVSRLQNAADAAALAGAQTIVKEQDFNNYLVISLASNELPADFDDYKDVYKNTFQSGMNGVLRNYKSIDDIKETLKKGRASAEEFARKNLSDAEEVNSSASTTDTLSAVDGWSISADVADKKVSGVIELKYKIVDGKNDVYGPLYYVVNLTEKVRHLFMSGWFDDMDAPVRAVVLLRPHYKGLYWAMDPTPVVIDNWEYANKYKGTVGAYAGKWNHYQAGIRNNNNYGIRYANGDSYRKESIIVTPNRKTANKNVITSADGSSGEATDANGGKWYSATEVDSINIDMRAEVNGKFSTDWDIGYDFRETGHSYKFMEGWSATDGSDKRILFNVEFDEPFPTRDTSRQADPLWVRIESDPIKNPYTGAGVNNFNSVRQITLNFNKKNTDVGEKDGNKYYKQRPYVIFYTGPENIDYTKDANGVLIRHSQPVVLNLNEDTNAIIYTPESPVIINGNNHTWHGFIIAKCFLQSVTEEEMLGNGSITLFDGFNEPSKFKVGFTKGTDGTGQTIYFRSKDLLTKEEIDAAHEDCEVTKDSTTGNIVVNGAIPAPKYPIISFSKDLYTNCTTLEEYFTATANYINTTYTKAKYAQYAGISESEVSMITFPTEYEKIVNRSGNLNNTKYGNFTAITIPVATADLLDSDPDPDTDPNYLTKTNKYVKVMLGTTEKYIAKSKLPHMRIKRNENCPYVCIYDLKTGITRDGDSSYATVKPMDDSTSTADSAAVFTNSTNQNVLGNNKWGNVWIIERQLLENMYDVNYKADKLQISEKNGFKYFILKSEISTDVSILAKYHKITLANGEIRYVKDGDEDDIEYYTKVYNNATNHDNYIIVNENGNMLTRAVTAPEVLKDNITTVATNESIISKVTRPFGLGLASEATLLDYWKTYTRDPKDPDEIPGDRGEASNNKYVGLSEYRKYEDYRIPALERVYKMSTFNLNNNSCYSYFGIEDLWRVNYTYLNVNEFEHTVNHESSDNWKVDDMFFTTTRSEWID